MNWFLKLAFSLSLCSSAALAKTSLGTYQAAGGPQLKYLISTPFHSSSEKKTDSIWIFQDDDGKLNNTFNFARNLLRAEMISKTQKVIFVWPELRREHFAKDLGPYCALDFRHREQDLHALIDQIKTLDFVDPSRIYLIGHHAGSEIATLVANSRSDLAGVVTVSGNFSAPFAKASQECAKAEKERRLPANFPWACQALSNQCTSDKELSLRSGSFWQQFFEIDMTNEIGKARAPYLALVGDEDSASLSDLVQHRNQIGELNPKFQYQVVPGMDEDLGYGLKVWSAIRAWTQSHP